MRSIIFLLAFLICCKASAQDSIKEASGETLKQQVEAKRYVFVAQSESPQAGGVRQLTSLYTLTILPDTIISDLPYIGRTYQSTSGSTDGGIKFTSLKFEYSSKNRKKGGWQINVKPKDVMNSPLFFITILSDGSVSMRISFTDRQSISFNGRLEAVKHKK